MRAEFKVHKLNASGLAVAREMAERFDQLLTWCESVGVPGRELSLVKTKLEEACFFAKKAMACNPVNQEQE